MFNMIFKPVARTPRLRFLLMHRYLAAHEKTRLGISRSGYNCENMKQRHEIAPNTWKMQDFTTGECLRVGVQAL